MTYTEAKGHKPFDWLEFVTNNTPIGDGCDRRWWQLEGKAKNWEQCAIGQLTNNLPRKHDGLPVSRELVDLGADFYYYFWKQDQEKCISILHKIKQKEREIMCRINGKAKAKARAKRQRKEWWRRKFNLK